MKGNLRLCIEGERAGLTILAGGALKHILLVCIARDEAVDCDVGCLPYAMTSRHGLQIVLRSKEGQGPLPITYTDYAACCVGCKVNCHVYKCMRHRMACKLEGAIMGPLDGCPQTGFLGHAAHTWGFQSES